MDDKNNNLNQVTNWSALQVKHINLDAKALTRPVQKKVASPLSKQEQNAVSIERFAQQQLLLLERAFPALEMTDFCRHYVDATLPPEIFESQVRRLILRRCRGRDGEKAIYIALARLSILRKQLFSLPQEKQALRLQLLKPFHDVGARALTRNEEDAKQRFGLDALQQDKLCFSEIRRAMEQSQGAFKLAMEALESQARRADADMHTLQKELEKSGGKRREELLLCLDKLGLEKEELAADIQALRESRKQELDHFTSMASEKIAQVESQKQTMRQQRRKEAERYTEQLRTSLEAKFIEQRELDELRRHDQQVVMKSLRVSTQAQYVAARRRSTEKDSRLRDEARSHYIQQQEVRLAKRKEILSKQQEIGEELRRRFQEWRDCSEGIGLLSGALTPAVSGGEPGIPCMMDTPPVKLSFREVASLCADSRDARQVLRERMREEVEQSLEAALAFSEPESDLTALRQQQRHFLSSQEMLLSAMQSPDKSAS